MKTFLPLILFLFVASSLAGQTTNPNEEKSYPLFSVKKDTTNENPFVFYFNDKSAGNITSWHWDFGDGATSDKQYPKHEYNSPGIYQACLTVHLRENDTTEIDRLCKKVRVAEKGYFNLGGHVFVSQLPIEKGSAYLYKFDSTDKLYPVDTSGFDTLGYYYFYQKKAGRYIVKARAPHDEEQYSSYMPSYYGDVAQWKNAEVIEFDTTMWEYDINLIRASYATSGFGKIRGNISYDTLSRRTRNLMAENIPIYLINEDGRHLCSYSDSNGVFEFNNLSIGNYHVHAEVTGLESVPLYRTIGESANENTGINLYIKEEKVVADIAETPGGMEKEVSQVFPNPVKDRAQLKINPNKKQEILIEVYDQRGRLVKNNQTSIDNSHNIITIEAGNLPAGIYNLKITPSQGTSISRNFLKQ